MHCRNSLLILLLFIPLSLSAKGWITVQTSVYGGEVVVDQGDIFTKKGKQITLLVEKGLHTVLVSKDGYRTYLDTITVDDNINHLLNVWLEPMNEKILQRTTDFKRTSWDYQVANGRCRIRWFTLGAGLGTGATMHASLFNIRCGLFEINPCAWGFNAPFYSDVTHERTYWLVHPRDRHSDSPLYEMAIPSQGIQFYYAPTIGVHLPIHNHCAIVLNAGPQISWTRVTWSYQIRELPTLYGYAFTKDAFPRNGYHFDSPWFTLQAGCLFTGTNSDLLSYLRYQDGIFLGIEMRF